MAIDTVNSATATTALHNALTGVQKSVSSPLFSNVLNSRAISSGSVDLDEIFERAGQKYNINPNLLKAVAKVESNFRADATSRCGAMGIMQLMPGTARGLGVDDPYDPEQNIMGGAKYLRTQLDRFDGNIKFALAAYNAGPAAVAKHGGIPPFKETQAYVPKVLSYFGSDDLTAGMLTYEGFDMNGKMSETSANKFGYSTLGLSSSNKPGVAASDESSFNYNETLAQMLFIKLIEMQMRVPGGKNSGPMF